MTYQPEDPILQAIKRLVQPGMHAFDIGANRGLTASALSEAGAVVYAFEPIESCAAQIEARNLRGVTVVQTAVSDEEGVAEFHLDLREGIGMQASSLRPLDVHSAKITVPMTTIDAFVTRTGVIPDFIKIDVEGVEERVIAGGMRTIRNHRPIMIFEVWGYNWPRFEALVFSLSDIYRFECASDGSNALVRYRSGVVTENDDVVCLPLR